jgi:hypothetical protein
LISHRSSTCDLNARSGTTTSHRAADLFRRVRRLNPVSVYGHKQDALFAGYGYHTLLPRPVEHARLRCRAPCARHHRTGPRRPEGPTAGAPACRFAANALGCCWPPSRHPGTPGSASRQVLSRSYVADHRATAWQAGQWTQVISSAKDDIYAQRRSVALRRPTTRSSATSHPRDPRAWGAARPYISGPNRSKVTAFHMSAVT